MLVLAAPRRTNNVFFVGHVTSCESVRCLDMLCPRARAILTVLTVKRDIARLAKA